MKNTKTKDLTLTAIFIALILLFALTPFGFINLGFIRATLIHIPVIIGSILLGPKIGAFLGTIFGFMSLLVNTMTPTILSFVFSPFIPVIGTTQGSPLALIICFVPRILVGIIPFYLWKLWSKSQKDTFNPTKQKSILFIIGIIGSMVNTILVMNMIYFLFNHSYAEVTGITIQSSLYKAVLTIIFVNGVPEAILSGIAVAFIVPTLLKTRKRGKQF